MVGETSVGGRLGVSSVQESIVDTDLRRSTVLDKVQGDHTYLRLGLS